MEKCLKRFSSRSVLFLTILGLAFTSCSDDDDGVPGGENATLSVRMTDAPGDYEAVKIDVQDVLVQREMAEGEIEGEAWESLENVETGIYDLLQLTGGITQLLASQEIPAGYLGQIRLVLGDDNSLVINGQEEPLSTPSAQQSGLKLNVQQELEAGTDYEYLLDFDVERSIVTTGNGGYSLNPVIRISAFANTGTIVGEIHPTEFQALVTATNGSHEIGAYTNEDGQFTLHGVPAGIYKVVITPDAASGFSPMTKNDVEVQSQETTDLETIFIDGKEEPQA